MWHFTRFYSSASIIHHCHCIRHNKHHQPPTKNEIFMNVLLAHTHSHFTADKHFRITIGCWFCKWLSSWEKMFVRYCTKSCQPLTCNDLVSTWNVISRREKNKYKFIQIMILVWFKWNIYIFILRYSKELQKHREEWSEKKIIHVQIGRRTKETIPKCNAQHRKVYTEKYVICAQHQ